MIVALTVPRSGTHFIMWLLDQLGVDARFCHSRRVHDSRISEWANDGVKFVSTVRNPWDVLYTSYNKHPGIDLTDDVLDEFAYMDELRKRYQIFDVKIDEPRPTLVAELANYCGVPAKAIPSLPVVGWSDYQTDIRRSVDQERVKAICRQLGYSEQQTWNDPRPRPEGFSISDMASFMESRHAIYNTWRAE